MSNRSGSLVPQPTFVNVPIPLPRPIVIGDPPAYTVEEFCEAHRISKPALYEMVADGRGPKIIRKGESGIIIPREAAEEWRRTQAQDWIIGKARPGAGRKQAAAESGAR